MMKLIELFAVIALPVGAIADPFQNLGFESATTNSLRIAHDAVFDYEGLASELLPSWQLLRGGQPVTTIPFNYDFSLLIENSRGVTLRSSEDPYGWRGNPLEGKYSLTLDVEVAGQPPVLQDYALIQRGDIPSDAKFLTFMYVDSPFAVSINGSNLSSDFQQLVPSLGPPRTVVVDIERFAGQNVELRFTPAADTFGSIGSFHTLDAVAFVVPEPSVFSLLGLGLIGWLFQPSRRHGRVSKR